MKRYTKPEPSGIRGPCVKCGENPQSHLSAGKFRALCLSCHGERYPAVGEYRRKYVAARRLDEGFVQREKDERQRVGYKKFKKSYCEKCGFVAQESCQLDVDHVDGDKANNEASNLQTLCANCHRLKTYLSRNFRKKATAA